MNFREAVIADIPQMQLVRNAVKENRLSDPSLVPDKDYEDFILHRGKGWVCEAEGKISGFCFADLVQKNIWALFVHPDYEGQSIGKKLQELMLDWYFSHTKETVWLGTAPGTRAEKFYTKTGWKNVGWVNKGEIKFEMNSETWEKIKNGKKS
jgi:GNAT superfamily N-acetyltransferase